MVYLKRSDTSCLIIGVYVEELIITRTENHQIENFKSQMKNKFEMSDLVLLTSYLGIEVTQESGKILLLQRSYALRILEQSGMSECNPSHPSDLMQVQKRVTSKRKPYNISKLNGKPQ